MTDASRTAAAEADRRRSRAEDALLRSEERYRTLFDAVPVGLYRTTSDGRIANANPAMAQMLGFATVEALIGSPAVELYVRADVRREWTRRLETEGLVRGFEAELRRQDGSALWALESARAALDDDGRILHIEGTVQDITERKLAEVRLRESEEQYHLLFRAHPHPISVIDTETLRFLAVNDAAVASYGFSREEFLSMTAGDLHPPETLPEFRAGIRSAMATGGALSVSEARHRRKDGTIFDVQVTASPLSFGGRDAMLAMGVDVTEPKRAAAALAQMGAQLGQSQKMEAIGQLAGGVAHDFNNLLGVVIGYSDLLLRDAPRGSPTARRLAEIRDAAERAAALTRDLLAFGRRQVLQPRVLDLNAVITEARAMLSRVISEKVEIVTVLDPGLGRVRADPGQLQQVILNFAMNARDAMPAGGTLTLQTRNAELDAAAAAKAGLAPGAYVALLVGDTGHGVAPEVLEHLFEPFFSTREQGLGGGLGLATAYGIVTQSGGHLDVQSAVGQGTTFTVYLPRAEAVEEKPDDSITSPAARATDTILLVEDAAPLREMVMEILEGDGFRVITAENGERAIETAAAHEGPIAILLTDVVMPGISGPAVAARLQQMRPDMRVLLMSGYADAAVGTEVGIESSTHFLQKPFSADVLLQKVREVLAAPVRQGTGTSSG